MTGLAPLPQLETISGRLALPEALILRVPSKLSPRLNRIASPGLRLGKWLLTRARVFHGVALFCAWAGVRLSSPVVLET